MLKQYESTRSADIHRLVREEWLRSAVADGRIQINDLSEKLTWRVLQNKPLQKDSFLRFLRSEILRRGFVEFLIKRVEMDTKSSQIALQAIYDKPLTFANILIFSELARNA